MWQLGLLAEVGGNLVRESGRGGAGYLLAQEWAILLLSLALAAVRKFMVTELQWLTLVQEDYLGGNVIQDKHIMYIYCKIMHG